MYFKNFKLIELRIGVHIKYEDLVQICAAFFRRIWFYFDWPQFSKIIWQYTIPGVPKKQNGGFPVPFDLKVLYVWASLNKASSAEENDTKTIEFGWAILIICPFLETQSSLNFAWFFATNELRLCREWLSIRPFPLTLCLLLTRINGLPQKHHMDGLSLYNSTLIRSVVKIKRSLNMTVFQEMGIKSRLLNQIKWSWHHSLLRKMMYYMM